ncbi:MAG: bifunctional methylenetetrahydrofolate dehydrogenase/methenyltetrahydrofolate cyclohydrolase [Legionellales bacterium RIFCSPHIGHO2_12_FULL_37_14]|nr:MAG: bifunctional methylenetetrahydrofolate dehydrogenase/methenyltetrahydrofolate cyclohydrolase [Legionellales bacterium RIFCSPHIGHO2_12_FULL_37_14]
MSATLLDGKSVALKIKQDIALKIENYIEKGLRAPGLAVILANNDPASFIYVKNKRQASASVNIHSYLHHLKEDLALQELLDLIAKLNADPLIDGILVQLPLPKHIDTEKIIAAINPSKDVDGFHPYNLGRLLQKHPTLRPCTPYGIMQLLKAYNIDVAGKNAVVVGASNIVGRPMGIELLNAQATVTICHKKTQNLRQHVKEAEILVVATGHKNCIASEWLNKNQVVIDVGIHHLPNNKISGDINFKEASKIVKAITPVPGGVGPMTVATLLLNTIKAYDTRMLSKGN